MSDLFIDSESSFSGPTAIVDPANYRSFCFRGEGRCNFVISAKESKSNLRIVWRLAKHRKSGLMTTKPKCEIVNGYLEKMISLFLRDDYLIKVKIVHIHVEQLLHLAKIPSLPHNFKIEGYDELKDELKYPTESSFFPLHLIEEDLSSKVQYVCALEMPDATRIPRHIPFVYGPTITVEIKPKQGFLQSHPGVDVPFCNNCILQIEKWRAATFDTMYDFCPLDLYSGERDRMRGSIRSLIHDPHRNFRIFVDGDVVHDEDSQLSRPQLNAMLFPNAPADIDTFISVIVCVLAGMTEEPLNPEEFYLRNDSVLSDLLRSQKIDSIGIVKAYEYFKSLSQNDQMELWNKSNLVKRGDGLNFLKKSDPRSLVEQYLLAASMKDCSLMISVRLVAKSDLDNLRGTNQNAIPLIGVNGTDGKRLYFAHSTRIVDLDPKSAKNLENAYCRFITGVEFLRSNPYIHKPCK